MGALGIRRARPAAASALRAAWLTVQRIAPAVAIAVAIGATSSPAFARKLGPEFRVNTTTAEDQWFPAIAGLADGGFVVTWASRESSGSSNFDVYAQRYRANGKPLGTEFRVNTLATGDQGFQEFEGSPSVTGLSGGGFVVVWSSNHQDDNGGYNIYAQRFRSDGKKIGREIRVNISTAFSPVHPVVAALADGGFVVTWLYYGGTRTDIYGQRFDSAGRRVGRREFRVNTPQGNLEGRQSVAGLSGGSGGGFVVVWETKPDPFASEWTLLAQLYDGDGKRVGGEFGVIANPDVTNQLGSPAAAALSGGGFVVIWHSIGEGGVDGYDTYRAAVYGQRFTSTGTPAGGRFRVNTYKPNFQTEPSVAGLADGGFVVTWKSIGQDGAGDGVYAQRYDNAGARVGRESRVNTYTADHQSQPAVAALGGGGFVSVWQSYGQDGSESGVYGQRYSP